MKPLSKLVKDIIELETCNVALQPILFWSTSTKVHSRVQEVKIFSSEFTKKTRLVTTGDIANHQPVLDEANWDRFGSRQDVKSWRSWKRAKQFLTLINLNVMKNKLYFLTYFLLPYCLVQRLQPGFVCFSLVQSFPCLQMSVDCCSVEWIVSKHALATCCIATRVLKPRALSGCTHETRTWGTKWRRWLRATRDLLAILCIYQRSNSFLRV